MTCKVVAAVFVLTVILAAGQDHAPAGITLDQVTAAAKIYFRDIDELPMTVAVTKAILDQSGKLKKQSRGSVEFLFHGYNPVARKGTASTNYGFFKKGVMKESVPGSAVVLVTGVFLKKELARDPPPQREQPAGPGQPLKLRFSFTTCSPFEFNEGFLVPRNFCGSSEYQLVRVEGKDDLLLQHYSFDSTALPAEADIEYFGKVKILGYHVDEDFQQAFLPNDPKPFLMPRQIVTTISTDKGKIILTNEYVPKKQTATERNQ